MGYRPTVSIVTCLPRRMLFLEPFLCSFQAQPRCAYLATCAVHSSACRPQWTQQNTYKQHRMDNQAFICVNHTLLVSTLFELIVSYRWLYTSQVAACRPGRHMHQGYYVWVQILVLIIFETWHKGQILYHYYCINDLPCRASAHVPHFKGSLQQLLYECMPRVSAHADQKHKFCLSAHGCSPGTLQYL